MSCASCGAVEQHGRFCVRCGRTMPPQLDAPRRISLGARPYLADDDMTQPVLRFRHAVPRPRVPAARDREVPA